jgi:hypothetical protein
MIQLGDKNKNCEKWINFVKYCGFLHFYSSLDSRKFGSLSKLFCLAVHILCMAILGDLKYKKNIIHTNSLLQRSFSRRGRMRLEKLNKNI